MQDVPSVAGSPGHPEPAHRSGRDHLSAIPVPVPAAETKISLESRISYCFEEDWVV